MLMESNPARENTTLDHQRYTTPILVLEAGFPLNTEVIPRVVDYLLEGRDFGGTCSAFSIQAGLGR